ncbi:MAG TPA: hypothetical protein VFL74_06665 [Sphingomicrobium sp.]|nr:hypothetical protein [Sphingomicrobium sp.]
MASGMDVQNPVILYRANRLRFLIGVLILLPCTFGIAALGYDGLVLGDSEVRGAWLAIPLGAFFIWFDYMVAAKLIRPPELEISLKGIRWENCALLQWDTNYGWQDIDGPEHASSGYGVPLLQIVVKASGRKLSLAPSHFGATYSEMAEIILAARSGKLLSPEEWRSEHPQHPFRRWLLNWGLPLSLAVVIAIALGWFKH